MQRAIVNVLASLVLLTAAAWARPVRADAGPPLTDTKRIAYSYEIENAEQSADKVIVLWPRNCGSYGDPLGKVDLALNPDWASRRNEVDYEVVVKGKRHELLDHCTDSARFYALPVDAFPRGTREGTADDMAIGQKAGVPFAILPALDAITIDKRIDFFAKDTRVLRASFRFDAVTALRAASTVTAVHDILSVDGFGVTAFSIVPKRAMYTYTDGSLETVSYVGAARRAPSRAGALIADPLGTRDASTPGIADAAAEAGAVAGAGATVTEAEPRPSGVGTRWVVLAAVGGLFVGGSIAFIRKKKQSKTPPP